MPHLLPMKMLLHLFLVLSASLLATVRLSADSDGPKFSEEELEKVVAPIALYPDSLVAIILPASTASSDIVLAARYLSGGGTSEGVVNQGWADSVVSLAHYPDVVAWMDSNLEWTQQLGAAFTGQPSEVMDAIQRLRLSARQNGQLVDTPQQTVVVENDVVYVQPADPDVIYVPRYDAEWVWSRRPCSGGFLSFGVGFSVGNWLFFDCGWSDRVVYVHNRDASWHYVRGWRPPPPAVRPRFVHPWRPNPQISHARPGYRDHTLIVRPHTVQEGREHPERGHSEPWNAGPRQQGRDVRSERNDHWRNDHRDAPRGPGSQTGPDWSAPQRPQPPAIAPVPPRGESFRGNRDVRMGPSERPSHVAPPTPPAHVPSGGDQSMRRSETSQRPRPHHGPDAGARGWSQERRAGEQSRSSNGSEASQSDHDHHDHNRR